jgi:probable rRNA maturation factor
MHDVRIADPEGALPLDGEEVARWTRAVLDAESPESVSVSLTFLDTGDMQRLNRESLGHDRATDVIAFRLEHPAALAGDVYVCPSLARENAAAAGVTVHEELARLVVHGVLHVLGYDHPDEPAARTASRMWAVQEGYVRSLTGRPA